MLRGRRNLQLSDSCHNDLQSFPCSSERQIAATRLIHGPQSLPLDHPTGPWMIINRAGHAQQQTGCRAAGKSFQSFVAASNYLCTQRMYSGFEKSQTSSHTPLASPPARHRTFVRIEYRRRHAEGHWLLLRRLYDRCQIRRSLDTACGTGGTSLITDLNHTDQELKGAMVRIFRSGPCFLVQLGRLFVATLVLSL